MVKDSRAWLMPVGYLYGQAMDLRNRFYDQGWLRSRSVARPVISVGNLTVGGAGKTPVVMAFLNELKVAGFNPGVISRGYGRQGHDVLEVNLSLEGTRRFGDEPVLIKSRFPEVPVFVGAGRVDAAEALLKTFRKVDVLVADDAFQHRALKRHLDVVVLDASQSLRALKPMPWGLAREESAGLQRAGLIILNKVNLAEDARLDEWRRWLELQGRVPVVEAAYVARPLEPLVAGGQTDFLEWFACAGLARPETFYSFLREQLQLNISDHFWFNDHHPFRASDLDQIESRLRPNQGVVISEKDAVKWRGLRHSLLAKVVVAGLELKWVKNQEAVSHALATLPR